jgi:hypothetical protein
MKIIINKFKQKKGITPYEAKGFSSGFVILFAVTLSSIILSIALGISTIAFKEASFSTSAEDSNDAFLAADIGSECALFYDKLSGSSFPPDGVGAPATINCAGQDAEVSFIPSVQGGSYNFKLKNLGSANNSCANVNIEKDTSEDPIKITINSAGYNTGDADCTSTNPRRVEREISVSSYRGASSNYTPSSPSVDLKFNGADCPVGTPCTISYNTSGLLSWSASSSITSCVASNDWSGSKTWPTGSENTGSLTTSKTYTITCSGVQGPAQDSVVVNVGAAPAIPTLASPTVSGITSGGATLGANVTSLGNPASISARGTCWGTSPNPTTNCVAEGGTTTGAFTHARTGMPSSTLIYYRGYATNTTGTGYSPDATFTTSAAAPTSVYLTISYWDFSERSGFVNYGSTGLNGPGGGCGEFGDCGWCEVNQYGLYRAVYHDAACTTNYSSPFISSGTSESWGNCQNGDSYRTTCRK